MDCQILLFKDKLKNMHLIQILKICILYKRHFIQLKDMYFIQTQKIFILFQPKFFVFFTHSKICILHKLKSFGVFAPPRHTPTSIRAGRWRKDDAEMQSVCQCVTRPNRKKDKSIPMNGPSRGGGIKQLSLHMIAKKWYGRVHHVGRDSSK